MDVALHARWEIVIDDQVDAAEVHASPHELRRDQDPNATFSELLDDALSLGWRSLGVNDVDVETVVDELAEKIVGSRDGLDKDESRWLERKGWSGGGGGQRGEWRRREDLTEGLEFVGFGTREEQTLVDEGRRRISEE